MKTIEEKLAARQELTRRWAQGQAPEFPFHQEPKDPAAKKSFKGIRKIRGNKLYG